MSSQRKKAVASNQPRPTVEQYLQGWADAANDAINQTAHAPPVHVTPAEWEFVAAVRRAASRAVGYGWMQTIIEVEWNHRAGYAWGPAYFEGRVKELERELAELRLAQGKPPEPHQRQQVEGQSP